MKATLYLYTDGGCIGNPGPGGWGTIALRDGRYEELGGAEAETTNNRMELTAALRGLALAGPGETVEVVSDSRYLIDGMTSWLKGWKARGWKKADGDPVLNQDLWEALDRAAAGRRILWVHVRGHRGHPENERCDKIANGFARGEPPELLSGDGSWIFAPKGEKKGKEKPPADEKLPAPLYLSCVGGGVEEHESWGECEARIKGVKGGRCKKVHTRAEYIAALEAWKDLA